MRQRIVVVSSAVISVVILILFIFVVVHAEESQQKRSRLQVNVNRVVNSIAYIKDPRTELCFAVYCCDSMSLATVPCNSIPSRLLTVAEWSEIFP